MRRRPENLFHWSQAERAEESVHPATKEKRGFNAALAYRIGLSRIGVHHQRLPPGRRSSPPHAERDDEEMVFVLEGTPDLWQDGRLHRLRPGVSVGWFSGTGIAHSIINNSKAPVRLLTVGEVSRYVNRIHFPTEPRCTAFVKERGEHWADAPKRRMGTHDGKAGPAKASAKLPPNAIDWRALKPKHSNNYAGSTELLADYVRLNTHLGLGRIGGGIDILPPGRRVSFPHAERDEEEFVFVLEGAASLWQDGHVYDMTAGDFAGWVSGTGIAHTILNTSSKPAILLTFGEASRAKSRVHYPLNPAQNRAMAKMGRWWDDAPKRRLGPHDGRLK